MDCPHCGSAATTERSDRTALGHRQFRRRHCDRGFNERTGTPYNWLQYPTDIVLLVVLWRLRYKLSLRDLAEMFLERGFKAENRTRGPSQAAVLATLHIRVRNPRLAGPMTLRQIHGGWP